MEHPCYLESDLVWLDLIKRQGKDIRYTLVLSVLLTGGVEQLSGSISSVWRFGGGLERMEAFLCPQGHWCPSRRRGEMQLYTWGAVRWTYDGENW